MHHIQGCEKKCTWEEYFLWQKLSRNNKIRTQIQPTNKQKQRFSFSFFTSKTKQQVSRHWRHCTRRRRRRRRRRRKVFLELEREKLLEFWILWKTQTRASPELQILFQHKIQVLNAKLRRMSAMSTTTLCCWL